MSLKCYKCGKQLAELLQTTISRTEACLGCMADIRCCKMCQFYDPKSYNECREPLADRIANKEKANFCDYFKICSSYNDAEKQRQEALARAQALFKK